jgi:DNA-directed RNA polymerase subunit M/transcription elongation factor TFIIS
LIIIITGKLKRRGCEMMKVQQQKREKQEYIKEIIETSTNEAHRKYQIRCGNCGKGMIIYIIYYYTENIDMNLHVLIDYKCPHCGHAYEEIEL